MLRAGAALTQRGTGVTPSRNDQMAGNDCSHLPLIQGDLLGLSNLRYQPGAWIQSVTDAELGHGHDLRDKDDAWTACRKESARALKARSCNLLGW